MLGAAALAFDGLAARVPLDAPAPSDGRLIVCPTPIGNLEDITLRVLAALREADVVACEDTRRTRVLLDRYGVARRCSATTSTTSAARAASSCADARGSVVALVSDAGMPLVSDPGFVLVRACVAAGLAVEVLPGPSAALAALVASALPADRWRFVGFLPRKRGELERVFSLARRWSRLSRRGGWRRPWPCSPSSTRTPGGRLPRADQAPRGGRRGPRPSSPSARRRAARGEVVLVVAGAPEAAAIWPPPSSAGRLVAAGAKPRPAAASWPN